jgi:hypothetical protein
MLDPYVRTTPVSQALLEPSSSKRQIYGAIPIPFISLETVLGPFVMCQFLDGVDCQSLPQQVDIVTNTLRNDNDTQWATPNRARYLDTRADRRKV